MGFLKKVAKIGTFGIVGSSILKKKKKKDKEDNGDPSRGQAYGSLINTNVPNNKSLY